MMLIAGMITLSNILTVSSSQTPATTFWDVLIKYVIPISALVLSIFNLAKDAYHNRFSLDFVVNKCDYFPRSDHLATVMTCHVEITNLSKRKVTIKRIAIPGLQRSALSVDVPPQIASLIFPLRYADGETFSLGRTLNFPLVLPPESFATGSILFLYLPTHWAKDIVAEFEAECIGRSVKTTATLRNASLLTGADYLEHAIPRDFDRPSPRIKRDNDEEPFLPWD